MSLSGLLNIARSGILSQSGALGITGQNVTNATTAGYTKRVASLTPQVGGGVTFNGEIRTFDKFAYARVVQQTGLQSAADARSTALAGIEAIMAPTSGTIGDRATALMGSLTTLTAYPTDAAVRTDVLSKVADLASTVSSAAAALSDTSKGLLQQAQGVVSEINDRLGHIANLNQKIAEAQALGSDASSLRDERDQWVKEVGERVGVRTVEDPQGRVTLFGAGAVLVEGNKTNAMTLDLDANGKMRVTVASASKIDVTARLDSGSLGGLREARDVDLASAQAGLDSYAFDVANTINAVHASGFGSDGVTGRALFSVSATRLGAASSLALDPNMDGHPERVAAAGSAAELPGGNSGARALANLSESDSFGGTTITNRFANLASDVGARKANAEAEKSLRDDTLSLATTMSESASGVSLDEEMIDMSKYQRAFEAASKVLQTANELLGNFLRDI
ncbi:MAG TPA: flagellar hook-associated protein FlgK [Labilithrix sp.]|nr:flagellar hook-associated protein FlgK [Labilithrix sp.]